MTAKKTTTTDTIHVGQIYTQTLEIGLIGTSPLICNRMSQKAQRELLLPRGRKNAAEKQASLKHDPIEEFRASPYLIQDPEAPTYLAIMSSAIKGAMATAALDMPGTKKAQIGRLVYVQGQYSNLYGRPELFMSVTRSADINKTPDVRTRAIIHQWAVRAKITFIIPLLNETGVTNLLVAGGLTAGIGDWRPEKGKGSYGQYRVVGLEDSEFLAVVEKGGRAAQIEAMQNPHPYDSESEELLGWFEEEVGLQGKDRVRSNGLGTLLASA